MYCEIDICTNFAPCSVHDAYPSEVARIKMQFVRAHIPESFPACLGLLILEFYAGVYINSTLCDSKVYAQLHYAKHNQEVQPTDVRRYDSYLREMDALITTLCHYFRIGIADIIAEYAGARHFTGMNSFAQSFESCISVHGGIHSFHNDYSCKEMQNAMDTLVGWHHVLRIANKFFHGLYPSAGSFTDETMGKIFDNIIMISITNPLSKRKDMGFYDFLNFFYQLILLILPVDGVKKST